MSDWQPIETAPHNKPVLIFYRNCLGKGRCIKALRTDRFMVEATGDESDNEDGVTEYDEANDRYTYVAGWWEQVDNWCDYTQVKVHEGEPTHWQPLPGPPQ